MSSDWQESANRRRDFRHTAVQDAPVRTHAKKDTRRWCKGKEGRAHRGKAFRTPCTLGDYWTFVCVTCGRRLAIWHVPGGPLRTKETPKPDWVDQG